MILAKNQFFYQFLLEWHYVKAEIGKELGLLRMAIVVQLANCLTKIITICMLFSRFIA